ncbi:MAG: type IV pilus modification protein PilV [Pseudomonadota bacterium]
MKSLPARGRTADFSRGVTLVEVLVAILIVSFGLLAMAAMQANAIKFSKTSEMRAVATLLARDLGDRIRANSVNGVPSGNYNATQPYTALTGAPTVPGCANAASCTGAEIAARDMAEWRRALYASLPAADGYVVVNGTTAPVTVDIWLAWSDPQDPDAPRADAASASECPGAFVPSNTTNPPRCAYFRIGL